MSSRFFVTVHAPNKRALARLRAYGLDLFHSTAQVLAVGALLTTSDVAEREECCIDGLLTLDEVGQLVRDGYQIVVKEEAPQQTPGQTEVIEFEQWLKEMEE